MRVFNIVFCMLFGYISVIGFGLANVELFDKVIIEPINKYRGLMIYQVKSRETYSPSFYTAEKNPTKGVSQSNIDKSFGKYTFYISAFTPQARLIDYEGNIVHSWGASPKEIWTEPDDLAQNTPDSFFSTIRAFLNPKSGDAYIMYNTKTKTPGAIGLVKFDKNSNVKWVYEGDVHHDLAQKEDGNLYVLTEPIHYQKNMAFPDINAPYLDNQIVELSAQGEEIKKISFMQLFEQSKYGKILKTVQNIPLDPTLPSGDVFHSNTIDIIPEGAEQNSSMMKAGHLLVSLRNLNLLIIIDPDKEEITWASYGPWFGQHSPEVQTDGSVIMFDNQGNLNGEHGVSRVIKIDPKTSGIIWSYEGTEDTPLEAHYNSFVDVLPNNNILVTESVEGRIFEITPDKEIVWEYFNPRRIKIFGTSNIPSVYSGKRYSAEQLEFMNDM